MSLVRNLAIQLLDDGNGVNAQAWETLKQLLEVERATDIINAVQATDNRFYLNEGEFQPEDPGEVIVSVYIEDVAEADVYRRLDICSNPSDQSMSIGVEGCGFLELDSGSDDVVLIEFNAGVASVLVWNDIESADPVTISLEEAIDLRE